MRNYEVELKRTSYIIVTVEAEDKEDAERQALHEASQAYAGKADWEVESVELVWD